jgi:DNA polymerase-1
MQTGRENFVVIDGNAVLHKAFHGLPPFKTKEGELVNAVYGFATLVLTAYEQFKPRYIAAAFDVKKKTFRHETYANYKANRSKAPDELYAQLPRAKELLKSFEIPIYEKEGYEADDLIGTICTKNQKESLNTYIITGDMDALQLVNDKVFVASLAKGFRNLAIFDEEKSFEKMGVRTDQVIDFKGLAGDSADNIKGVNGVGKKTAQTLLNKYENIEGIYENIGELKGKLKERLENEKDSAFLSRDLATIIRDVDFKYKKDDCKSFQFDNTILRSFFANLEFKSLMNRLEKLLKNSETEKAIASGIQQSLF